MLRSGWRRRRNVLAGLLGLHALALCGWFAYAWLYGDDPPPEDSDLRLVRRVVAEEDNGFHLVDFKKGEVYWPQGDAESQLADEMAWIGQGAGGGKWDAELAERILKRNAAVLERFERSLELPDFQLPEVKRRSEESKYPVSEWSALGEVLQLRLEALLRRGKTREALQAAMKTVRFCHRIESAEGTLILFVLPDLLKASVFPVITRLVSLSRPEPGELRELARELGKYGGRKGLENSLKLEYTNFSAVIDRLARERLDSKDLSPNLPRDPIAFKPNRTKRLMAATIRRVIACPTTSVVDDIDDSEESEKPSGVLSFLGIPSRNSSGRLIWRLYSDSIGGVLRGQLRAEAHLAATRAIIALKAYHDQAGRLPASLDELAPRYIDRVPLDPYDDEPLRYSPDKKIVYSVGEDLEDSEGSSEEDEDDWPDDRFEPTFKISF